MFKEKLLKKALKQFAGEHVLNDVLIHGYNACEPKVEEKHLTMYVQRLGGYDHGWPADRFSAADYLVVLSDYLDIMTECISKHGGFIGNINGDTITAFWGMDDESSKSMRAARCALECLNQTSLFSEKWAREYGSSSHFYIRIGIHSGNMMFGNFGSEERLYFIAFGHASFPAYRIANANRYYQTKILFSEFTDIHSDKGLATRFIEYARVPGYHKPFKIYELLGQVNDTPKADKDMLHLFESGIKHYFQREFDEAAEMFGKILSINPHDGASSIYLSRCEAYKNNPPKEDWDGVFINYP